MIKIELEPVASQSLSFVAEQTRFELTFRKQAEIVTCDIVRDNETILLAARCLPDQPIIPYKYLEGGKGNFAIFTENDEIPDCTLFGVTQFLYYLDPSEMEELRGNA